MKEKMEVIMNNTETSKMEWDETLLKYMGDVNIDEIKHYKFRAECEHDANKLRKRLGMKCFKIVKTIKYYFPDAVVDLYTTLSLEEIRDVIREIPDGHVMLETVALTEEYTGERTFHL